MIRIQNDARGRGVLHRQGVGACWGSAAL